MANPSEKGNHYFWAVFKKAWEDISPIEAIAEGIVGLLIAAFLFFEGLFNVQNTIEAILDSFLFAVLFPIVHFILRVVLQAPGEINKELAESKGKRAMDINPKTVYPTILSLFGAFCVVLLIALGFSLKFNLEKISNTHKPENSQREDARSDNERPPPISASKPQAPLPDKIISQAAQPTIPVNITVTSSGLSVDDQAAIADFQQVYRDADVWNLASQAALKEFERNATNPAVKEFEAERIKTFLWKIETNAVQKLAIIRAEIKTNDDVIAIVSYDRAHSMVGRNTDIIFYQPNQTNEIVSFCLKRAREAGADRNVVFHGQMAPPSVWFLVMRWETGVNFEMLDFKAVEDWLKDHPSIASDAPAP